jgi:8-oxo-dGTP pyrophosphatase MutT (NUDIX family)
MENKVVLLKNERDEWDLPGGKLGRGEEVKSALKREVLEELGIEVKVEAILEAFTIRVKEQIDVLMVVYHCSTEAAPADLVMSQENFGLQLFAYEELDQLKLANEHLYETVRIAHQTLNQK